MNSQVPLCNESWDPETMQSAEDLKACVDDWVPRLFGISDVPDQYAVPDHSVEQLHMFESHNFAPFVKEMQANNAAGKTAVVRRRMVTVENTYLGVAAGNEIDVVLFYLSCSHRFCEDLPQDTRESLMSGSDGYFPNF